MTASPDTADRLGPDELRMLADTVAKVLSETAPAGRLDRLAELGWFELWTAQPEAAAGALFGQQGRLATSSPALAVLLGSALAPPASGSASDAPAALLPWLGQGWVTRTGDGRLPALAFADTCTGQLVAPVVVDGVKQVVTLAGSALSVRRIDGLDPELGLAEVDLSGAIGSAEPRLSGAAAEATWRDALALGRRLLAEELVAVVREQQRLAVEHALSRQQFGRPIGAFQAVKHKLAEVHVALVSAELAVEQAWADPEPAAATLAKLLAGNAVALANQHCQQVLGGIGFTWEHRFHFYVRRGRMLAALLGSSAELAAELGTGILKSGTLPVLAEL
ncbi:MAG TPA: acyl-CoA dehydrogenase family protein [Pseudonocardia sp.]|jgi:hypothetical protein